MNLEGTKFNPYRVRMFQVCAEGVHTAELGNGRERSDTGKARGLSHGGRRQDWESERPYGFWSTLPPNLVKSSHLGSSGSFIPTLPFKRLPPPTLPHWLAGFLT